MVERNTEVGAVVMGKKGGKKGFKIDRYQRYQEHRKNQQGFAGSKRDESKKEKPGSIKEVKFDAADRKDFLLGFHKRKNERRATAFLDAKHKQKVENAKFRRDQREEARKAYNAYAKVPILPDYTYHLPTPQDVAAVEGDEGHSDHDDPTTALATAANNESFFRADNELGDYGDGVCVTVQPLRRIAHGALPTSDFSDLPKSVAEELKRLKKETKGPAKTKAKKNTLKVLEKIRKIQKHCRKGHGKKSTAGKKRNR